MPPVVFNPTTFKARYPEFAAVSNDLLGEFFNEATLYLSNSDSPVKDETRRAVLLNMLTAHVAVLGGALGDGQARPVGRVTNASKGTVSAQMEYLQPGSHSWFTQTQYGAAFWQATVGLRSFHYIPKFTRV